MTEKKLDQKSLAQRRLIVDIVERSRRGHLGSALSILEITRVLYDSILRVDPRKPDGPDRDRFILSKGHGCLGLYVQLAEKGFFPKEELFKFCAEDGILGGHPEAATTPGVEASTGSLGHGFPIATGIAFAARMDRKPFRTFVLMGDGECNEGSVWEAALIAAKHKLDSLTVIVDYNRMQCYAPTSEVLNLEPFAEKWLKFNFEVREVDGHDVSALEENLSAVPFAPGKPSVLVCHTVKGKGIPELESRPEWHHKSKISDAEIRSFRKSLGEAR
jgi:transketolase